MIAKAKLQYPNLSKAPIVEAIIDFRVRPREGMSAESLTPLRDLIDSELPSFGLARRLQGQFEVKDGQPAGSSLTHVDVGFRAESADKRHVLQAHIDGLTFSRLRNYDRWETFRDDARRMWNAYETVAKPLGITRAAVRYINRIEYPFPIDFDDYLSRPPGIPDSLPQVVAGFLSRVVIPYENTGIQIVITQALEPPTAAGMVPVILDIDVFLEKGFAAHAQEHWEIMEELRHLKNRAFFGSLTEKTLEMLK